MSNTKIKSTGPRKFNEDTLERNFNILVYGMERSGLPTPTTKIERRNFTLHFEKFESHRRFLDFDGVIFFQGTFERFEHVRNSGYAGSFYKHTYAKDDLDKREKELVILLKNGGFICTILTSKFIDSREGNNYQNTDLSKVLLNYPHLYRKNFNERMPHVKHKADELLRFLEAYGAANTHFDIHNQKLSYSTLATAYDLPVGLLLDSNKYFIPSMLPAPRLSEIEDYFTLLADGITSIQNKIHQTVPEWVREFRFDEEESLSQQRIKLTEALSEIDNRIDQLTSFKAALIHSGAALVKDVASLIFNTTGLTSDLTDELREDAKLVNEEGGVVALCEIKGINKGIGRENINQTDSHRERSGFNGKFPAILIANTGIKQARSIAEKDDLIAAEQVEHATRNHILLMRTFDLLNMLKLVNSGKITKTDARELILTSVGWLRVTDNGFSILTGK